MHLFCPKCGKPVPADHVELSTMVAKCPACHTVFRFAHALEADVPDAIAPAGAVPFDGTAVPRPSTIQVQDDGTNLRLTYRWFRPVIILLAILCLFWIVPALIFFAGASMSRAPCFLLSMSGLHVASGLALAYYTLTQFVNSTTVDVTAGRLRIQHGPLPLLGPQDVDVRQLEQLYCKEVVHRGRGAPAVRYTLFARTRSGRSIKLVQRLPDAEEALFLEQQIERRLGIQDRTVRGELRR